MFWQAWSEDALQSPGYFLPPNFRNQRWEISLKKGEMTWRTVGRVSSLVCFNKLRNLSTPLQKMDLADETKSIGDSKIASILLKLHAVLLEKDYQIGICKTQLPIWNVELQNKRSNHRKIQVSLKIQQRKMVLYQSPNRYVSLSNYVLDTKHFRADLRLVIIWGQEIRQNLLPLL